MKVNSSSIWSTYFIILCISTLVYIEPIMDLNENSESPKTEIPNDEITDSIDFEDINDYTPIKQELIPGDFKKYGFFSGGGTEAGNDLIDDPEYPDDPENNDTYYYPNVIEWVTRDEIESGAQVPKTEYWRAFSDYPHTWPSTANVWHHLIERDDPREPSKMFSPVFTEDWEIKGRVYYLAYIETNDQYGVPFSEYINIDMKFSLHLFNPADNNKTLLTSVMQSYTVNISNIQRTFSSEIGGTYIIPAGYRLLYDVEYRFDTIPAYGSLLMISGRTGGPMSWTISDPVYGNSYTFSNYNKMAGVQLYMRKDVYPDMQIFNAVNETTYYSPRDITIDVTDGSTSSFRWNGNPVWTPFDNATLTPLPTEHGWNTLEVKASDPIYNNTVVEFYQFGYDESLVNIVLDNAINNSIIAGDYELQFSVYNISSAVFEWDNNGTEKTFEDPYTITGEDFSGLHNLTIITTDFYTNESFYYEFTFDNLAPTIILQTPNDGSFQSPGKNIDVLVNDSSGVDIVTYHWDSDAEAELALVSGIKYRTNLPSAGGWHYLYVTANDTHGNQNTTNYSFFTDPTILNVELRYMVDDSYYFGGNEVEVTITSSNDTIKYQWDNGIWKDKSDAEWDGTYLKLNNGEGLSATLGVHILKIRTGDISDVEETFTFTFTVDQQAPEYNISVLNFSNSRYLGSETLTFTVTDNYTLSSEILLDISIDGGFNQSLLFPFVLPLFSFFDGNHSIVIYVWDIAGNVNVTTIFVIIDNTAPDIDYIIPELVNYIHIDGHTYVPADALVDVTLDDDDSILYSYYSINGTAFSLFDSEVSDFNLGFLEGYLEIVIRANDSLGNYYDLHFGLTLDNSPPSLDLIFPFNYTSEINDQTLLQFNAQDISEKTINSVEYEWDANPGFKADAFPDINGDFEFFMITQIQEDYASGSSAILTFYLEDIVGNIVIINLNFIVDYVAPTAAFYILNDSSVYEDINLFYYVKGNTSIFYNNIENDDL
ncbi:MAG: hypothetical protein ACTSVO_05135, partial [Candidatus Heimdallarchaeaceae archaeon]